MTAPRQLDALLVTVLDDCTVLDSGAHSYEPGDHGSVYVAHVRPGHTDALFFQWKHGPLTGVETMRRVYQNVYAPTRQLSFKLSQVCCELMVPPSEVTYALIEQYVQLALAAERLYARFPEVRRAA